MNDWEKAVSVLTRSPEVLVTSHIAPDGDSIGSMFALGQALAERGQKVFLVAEEPVPGLYSFLEGARRVLLPDEIGSIPRVAVVVDCTDLTRVGARTAALLRQAETVINLDHHISNDNFGECRLLQPTAAAAGEIVYRLLQLMNQEITPPVATALYTAIVTDTGCFQYSSTTPQTHRIAADLLERGADMEKVFLHLYQNKPVAGLRLLGKALESLRLSDDGRVAWMSLSHEILVDLAVTDELCEGLINHPRSLQGVEIAILFRETRPGEVKVSFRSKTEADVNLLASRFNGGGHVRAAGCSLTGTLAAVTDTVVTAAIAYLRELHRSDEGD